MKQQKQTGHIQVFARWGHSHLQTIKRYDFWDARSLNKVSFFGTVILRYGFF